MTEEGGGGGREGGREREKEKEGGWEAGREGEGAGKRYVKTLRYFASCGCMFSRFSANKKTAWYVKMQCSVRKPNLCKMQCGVVCKKT